MKLGRLRNFLAAGLAASVILSGCAGGEANVSPADTSVQTFEAATAETVTIPEISCFAEEETEAPENDEPEYVEVSPGNEFIDFDFIEDYRGTTDIGELADKAVEFLTTTEEYAEAMSHFDEIDEEFGDPYIADGKIIPQFEIAYPNDYDGDGRTETFITVAMPFRVDYSVLTRFFLYADSEGNMTLLDHISGVYDTVFLNYGSVKQITFGGSGTVGIEDHTNLYGVKDGKADLLYSIRGEFHKKDCFLSAFGAQGSGAFMYYDTAACEYRAIAGEDIAIDKIKEMDSTDELSEFYEWLDEQGQLYAELIGGRYYVIIRGAMDTGTVYLYENGKFIQTEDCQYVRDSHYDDLSKVIDIDINKALAEMKKPAESFVKVSPGNEFIDFDFIEDYRGTDDIGELADKAVEFLTTTEEYAESMEHIDEFTDEKFAPYIKDGVIVSKLNTAYPEDYDGDGRTETFIVADMPVLQGKQPLIRSFLIFADSSGHMTLLGDESDLYDTILLDYGRFKQLIWGGFGTCGADENTCIYGVTDGQAKPLYSGRFAFRKENCFLTTHGHMNGGDFMYYDTAADDYVPIAGVEMTLDEIKAMDKDGALADYYGGDDDAARFFGLVGGKYYCVLYGRDITEAVFTFDGKFERVENSNVRLRFKDYYRSGEAVIDIDIDKALAEMKKP